MALDLDNKRPLPASGEDDAFVVPDPEAMRRQRLRSLALGWALFALAVMFFLVTVVRLEANVHAGSL